MFTPEILAAIVVAASVISTTAVVAMALRMPSAAQLSSELNEYQHIKATVAATRKERLDRNPFYKDGSAWNFTEQCRLLVDDLDTAKQLAAEAGVEIPPGTFERIKSSVTLPKEYDPWKETVSDAAPIVKVPKAKRRHLRAVKTRIRKAA